jgi:hypothetical protein
MEFNAAAHREVVGEEKTTWRRLETRPRSTVRSGTKMATQTEKKQSLASRVP